MISMHYWAAVVCLAAKDMCPSTVIQCSTRKKIDIISTCDALDLSILEIDSNAQLYSRGNLRRLLQIGIKPIGETRTHKYKRHKTRMDFNVGKQETKKNTFESRDLCNCCKLGTILELISVAAAMCMT